MLLLPVILFSVVTTLHALPTNHTDDLSSRILYGQRANIKDYPFFAALGVTKKTHVQYYCGAVILSKWWLATAAHCVDNVKRKRRKRVWVGEDSAAPTSQPYTVKQVVINPLYVNIPNGTSVNDIALLKLTRPLTFNNSVKSIELPKWTYEKNAVYRVAGMGNDETGDASKHLKSLNVRTIQANECKSFMELVFPFILYPYFDQATICTKMNEDKPGLCYGDSGSPLIQGNTLIGIASYIKDPNGGYDGDRAGYCKKARLFAFTNVAPFVGWIKQVTGIQ